MFKLLTHRYIIAIFAVCLQLYCLTSLQAGVVIHLAESEPSKRALLISVSKFTDSTTQSLRGSDNDVALIKEELLRNGYQEEDITVLSEVELPTREGINNALDKFLNSCSEGDELFVVFSGRGFQDKTTKVSFFIPMDFPAQKVYEEQTVSADVLISVDEVYHKLQNSKAKRAVLLCDFCRSYAFTVNNAVTPDGTRGDCNVICFWGCSNGELSFEAPLIDNGKTYSVFLYYFVDALRRGAVREDGSVSCLEAMRYAQRKTEQCDFTNEEQHPSISGESFHDFNIVAPREDFGAKSHDIR